MSVIRILRRENSFVQIDKTVFEDDRISWKAKGVLGYLLTKPADWKIHVEEVAKHGPKVENDKGEQISKRGSGAESVYQALKELRLAGYARLIVIREKGMIIGKEWEVSEYPAFSPKTDNPDKAKPDKDDRAFSNKDKEREGLKERNMSAKNAGGLLPLEDSPSQEEKPPHSGRSPKTKPDPNDPRPVLLLERQALLSQYTVMQGGPHDGVLADKILAKGKAIKAIIDLENNIDAVVQRLNEKGRFPRGYTTEKKETRTAIRKRLKEYSLEDLFAVVDSKCAEWKDTQFRKNLNPETLFNGHFEKYLNAALLDKQAPLPAPGQTVVRLEPAPKSEPIAAYVD